MQLPSLAELDTLPKLLLHNAANWPSDVAMREKDLGIWHVCTWAQYRDQVRLMALGLASLGLRRGEVVGLIGRNRPNWVWGELAAHALGCLSLGIYEDVLAAEAGYLIEAAGVGVVLCEDEEQVDKLLELDHPDVRLIVYRDDRGMRRYDDPRLVGWDRLLAEGRAAAGGRARAVRGRDRARPGRGRGDPVHHLGHHRPAQARHAPASAVPRAHRGLPARRPEAAHRRVCLDPAAALDHGAGLRRGDAAPVPDPGELPGEPGDGDARSARDRPDPRPAGASGVGADRGRRARADHGRRPAHPAAVRLGGRASARRRSSAARRHRLADLLVFSALRDRLGFSRLKSAATGGAALGPDTFRFFLAMGVPLKQLYGQTEAAGAYTLQVHPEVDCDTSGVPFDDTEIRVVDPDESGVGEIATRHPGLFKGYFGNEAATRETLAEDGWLRTGDAGFLDDKGRLTVIDRVKDIARTSTGIRFSPQFIENKLKFSPFVGECVVLGNGRPFLAAILCIRYSMVAKWAEGRRIGFTTYQNLAAHPQVGELLAGEVAKVNASLPEAQRIRRFLLLYKELDPDDGELTRTRKVRRNVVDERYAGLIEAIYRGQPQVHVETEVTFEDGRKGRIEADLADPRHRRPAAPLARAA